MSMYTQMLIMAAKTAILVLGGSITYYAYRAFQRTGDPSLRVLAIGFGVVTIGAFLGGVADLVLEVDFAVGVAVNSVLTAIGFGVILYSLYN